jgi:hypothetical protein
MIIEIKNPGPAEKVFDIEGSYPDCHVALL